MLKPLEANADEQPVPANANPTPGRKEEQKRRGRPPQGAPDWKPRFLRYLRLWNGPVLAARKAGVHPATAYKARESDPDFRAAWDEALELRKEWLDLQVLKRGLAGSDRCLLAKARAELPEKYGKKDPKPTTKVQPIKVIEIHTGGGAGSPSLQRPVLTTEPVRELGVGQQPTEVQSVAVEGDSGQPSVPQVDAGKVQGVGQGELSAAAPRPKVTGVDIIMSGK
jgi:hypothetical protein